MTMGDESLYAAMTIPVIIGPILERLEQEDMAAAQTLRAAFCRVEAVYKGFAFDFVKALLIKSEIYNKIEMCETLLKLEGLNDSEEFKITRPEPRFQEFNKRAIELKKILSKIPDQIYDRKLFLDAIKDIANAIRLLLDSVNQVTACEVLRPDGRQTLAHRKKEFIKYSKRFSTTLKDYFRENEKRDVFLSAAYLVDQTNLIMKAVKAAY
ncbi:programmed cell death protein 10-like [Argonauta hians]